MRAEKIQVVLLLDTNIPSGKLIEQQYKKLCLACTRILLLMSKFPNREHLHQFQWNYKLFSSAKPLKSVGVTTAQFQELHSEVLENFFGVLLEGLKNGTSVSESDKGLYSHDWTSCVYNGLAATVQDFIWDAPEIKTPLRRLQHRNVAKRKRLLKTPTDPSSHRNIIFIFSGGKQQQWSRVEGWANRILPQPLLDQLHEKRISVFWVDTGDGNDFWANSLATSRVLESLGGTVIPISRLLSPLHGNILQNPALLENSSKNTKLHECNEFWFCLPSGKIICALELGKMYNLPAEDESQEVGKISGQASSEPQQSFSEPAGSNGPECIGTISHQCSPVIVSLALIRESNVVLEWLSLMSVYSCSSLCVPNRIRSSVNILIAPQKKLPSKNSPTPSSSLPTAGSLPTSPAYRSLHKSPKAHLHKSPKAYFHKSPQIHLVKNPISSLSTDTCSEILESMVQKKPTSVPYQVSKDGEESRSCGTKDFSAILEQGRIHTCGSSSTSSTQDGLHQSSPPAQSRDLISHQLLPTCVCVDPQANLKELERLHSKQYQNVNSWLAKNKSLLLVKMVHKQGSEHFAVLQPVNSLVSTLILTKPSYYTHIQTLLADLPEPTGPVHLKDKSPSVKNLSLFSSAPLLPWFPYTQMAGMKPSALEQLQEILLDSKEDQYDKVKKKSNLISALRELYTVESNHYMDVMASNSTGESFNGAKEEEGEEEESKKEVESETTMATSEDELFDWFTSSYEEQISISSTSASMDALYRWVVKTLAEFLDGFREVVKKEVSDDVPLLHKFWECMESRFLSSPAQLAQKYQAKTSTKEEDTLKEINEYLIQVLLYFETVKLSGKAIEIDTITATADKLIAFLRKVSLLSDPRQSGRFMQSLILPMYISSCRELVAKLYEGLMLPLPSDIQESSPDPPSMDEDGDSYEMEMGLKSLEEPPAPRFRDSTKQRLMRHRSFQEVSTQRQIILPIKKKKKLRIKHASLRADEKMQLRRSPRLATISIGIESKRKPVCRNLFSRSRTVSNLSREKRKQDNKPKKGSHHGSVSDILVKETPVKKQVENYHKFKQERLRSKSSIECSPGLNVIKETPRRSFYSSVPKRHPVPISQFKTPPSKRESKALYISPSFPLNKDPSPAAIQSLLHDKFTSPSGKSSLITAARAQRRSTPNLFDGNTAASDVGRKKASPVDILSSTKLFEPGLDQQGASSHVTGSSRRLAFKSARQLIYEGEDPLKSSTRSSSRPIKIARTPTRSASRTPVKSVRTLINSNRTPIRSMFRTPIKSVKTPTKSSQKFIRTPIKSPTRSSGPTPVKSVRTSTKSTGAPVTPVKTQRTWNTRKMMFERKAETGTASVITPIKSTPDKVLLVSPPNTFSGDYHGNSQDPADKSETLPPKAKVGLLMDLDPSVVEGSASMVAFSLSTPTKDDPLDFHHAFQFQ